MFFAISKQTRCASVEASMLVKGMATKVFNVKPQSIFIYAFSFIGKLFRLNRYHCLITFVRKIVIFKNANQEPGIKPGVSLKAGSCVKMWVMGSDIPTCVGFTLHVSISSVLL